MADHFQITNDLLATKGQRLLNFIIDLAAVYIIGMCIGITIVLLAQVSNNLALAAKIQSGDIIEYGSFLLLLMILYYGLMEIYFTRTAAKYFTKTIVVTKHGSRPDAKTIAIRTFIRLIPLDPFTYLQTNSRGWHDSISKTYVVKKHKLLEKQSLNDSTEMQDRFR